MNQSKKLLFCKLFSMIAYMIGAWGIPVYLMSLFIDWYHDTYSNELIVVIPLAILTFFWFLGSLAIFGYAVTGGGDIE